MDRRKLNRTYQLNFGGNNNFLNMLERSRLDNKICQIRMEGEQFGGALLEIDLKLSVEDGPSSAGVMLDTIWCGKLALDRGLGGYLEGISLFAFKYPKNQFTNDEEFKMVRSL